MIYSDNENGFTMIELMLVIAIVGVLSGITFLASREMYANYQIRGAARQVFSDMQLARLNAIKRGEEWRVDFETDSKGLKYTVRVKDGAVDKVIYLTGRGALYRGSIKACNYSDNSNDPDNAEFNPDGTASAGGVKISNATKIYKIYVSSTGTGHVRILNQTQLAEDFPSQAVACP